jgi:hypothetical protein
LPSPSAPFREYLCERRLHDDDYNLAITGLSVAICLFIGTIEVLGLLPTELHLRGRFWTNMAGFNINAAGFIIVGVFVVTWAAALLSGASGRWRRGGAGSSPRTVRETWTGRPASSRPTKTRTSMTPGRRSRMVAITPQRSPDRRYRDFVGMRGEIVARCGHVRPPKTSAQQAL